MAEEKPMIMYAASYNTVPAALEALDAVSRTRTP